MVVVGKRMLTENFIDIFCAKSSLGAHDENYFRTLASYCQAKSLTQKRIIEKKLIELLRFDGDRVEIENYFEFMSSPLLPRLQTLLSFDDVSTSPENLGQMLNFSPDQINEGIERLCQLDLVESNDSQGQVKWRSKNKRIQVGNHLGDAAMEQFHTYSLQQAIQAQHLPTDIRRFRSLLIPLSADEFGDLLEEVETFLRMILSRFRSDNLQGRRLYQVNLNLFPITERADRNRDSETAI